ncbi:uncharacterized protein FJT64_000153 [Amphibalanus amphitrite]|uniref:Uncharacterized protein n=1 Tax=Amphibalanus amphitrite TaxID=1232801 RepID=A0A6A4VE65_AMPAM|nr:uncharacterized protein LOC122365449 [Amphibalanus amphitrite]KAF0292766.1 uncharacterized protein FJT64_000153 [Amphibalanus amphitrite]
MLLSTRPIRWPVGAAQCAGRLWRGAHLTLCSQPPPTDAARRRRQLREAFAEQERLLLTQLRIEELSEAERTAHEAHQRAVEAGHFTYDDPETGLRVLTRLRHFLRGQCCGNACRHCVYGHEAVPESVRARRRFNSAFWVDAPPPSDERDRALPSDDPEDVDFV